MDNRTGGSGPAGSRESLKSEMEIKSNNYNLSNVSGGHAGIEYGSGLGEGDGYSSGSKYLGYYGGPYQAPPRINREYSKMDIVFSGILLFCGFLFMDLISFSSPGLGVTLFVLLFSLVSGLYMGCSNYRQNVNSLLWLAVLLAGALQFALFDSAYLKGFNSLFLLGAYAMWVCCTTGRQIFGSLSAFTAGDLFSQVFSVPFSNFFTSFSGVKKAMEVSGKTKRIGMALLSLFFCIPLFFAVTALLVMADAVFELWVTQLRLNFTQHIWNYVVEIIFGIPVGCYFFGMLYGSVQKSAPGRLTEEGVLRGARAFQHAPGAVIYPVMTGLVLIYGVFFLSQTAYFLDAFKSYLPEGMTYAEYARRGFFELCQVSTINLVVILVAHLLLKRERGKVNTVSAGGDCDAAAIVSDCKSEQNDGELTISETDKNTEMTDQADKTGEMVDQADKTGEKENSAQAADRNEIESETKQDQNRQEPAGLRLMTVLLSAFTLLLITTAMSKMLLYIDSYGLTPLRVYTSWFMALLAILFILIIIRQVRRFNLTKTAVISFILCFMVLLYSNVDGKIAEYNIARYEQGTIKNLDLYGQSGLYTLGDGTIPHVCAFYERTEDEKLKNSLEDLLLNYQKRINRQDQYAEEGFRTYNRQNNRARIVLYETLETAGILIPDAGEGIGKY